jgi:hypothetical protein
MFRAGNRTDIATLMMQIAIVIGCLAVLYAAAMFRARLWMWALGIIAIAAATQFGILGGQFETSGFRFPSVWWLPAFLLSVLPFQ